MSDPKAPAQNPRQVTSQPQEPKNPKGDPNTAPASEKARRPVREGEKDERSGQDKDGLH